MNDRELLQIRYKVSECSNSLFTQGIYTEKTVL